MIPKSRHSPAERTEGVCLMFVLMIGLAFVAMILGPAILTAIQNARSRQQDL
jgi:hypothetical protein